VISLKKSISIAILSLFIYNSFGFLAVHPFLSMYYKNLGMQKIEKSAKQELIEFFIFDKKDIAENKIDFKWIHSREFIYNGEMYDIVKKEENDIQLFLYCINDIKEKKLEEEFAKKVQNNSTNSKHRQVSNHLNILLSEPVQTNSISVEPICEFNFYNLLTDCYKSINLDIPSPPPRIT
jgi:hypothetical protein